MEWQNAEWACARLGKVKDMGQVLVNDVLCDVQFSIATPEACSSSRLYARMKSSSDLRMDESEVDMRAQRKEPLTAESVSEFA